MTMSSKRLAIQGGLPEITEPFPPYRSIGKEEIEAANRVLNSGVLSGFIGLLDLLFMEGQKYRHLNMKRVNFSELDT